MQDIELVVTELRGLVQLLHHPHHTPKRNMGPQVVNWYEENEEDDQGNVVSRRLVEEIVRLPGTIKYVRNFATGMIGLYSCTWSSHICLHCYLLTILATFFVAATFVREVVRGLKAVRPHSDNWAFKYQAGHMNSREDLVPVLGSNWYIREYPSLPGSPVSECTEDQFKDTFELTINTLSGVMKLRFDTTLTVDGRVLNPG